MKKSASAKGFSLCITLVVFKHFPNRLSLSPAGVNAGSTFRRWEGDCSGTGTCTLAMNGNHAVTAVYVLVSTVPANPANLEAFGITGSSISLKWSKNPGDYNDGVTYHVFRSNRENGVFYRVNTAIYHTTKCYWIWICWACSA